MASMVWGAAINTLTKRIDARLSALFRAARAQPQTNFLSRYFFCHRFVKRDNRRDEFHAFNVTSHELYFFFLVVSKRQILQARTCEAGICAHDRAQHVIDHFRWFSCEACLRIEA
jgi:hypothetical protein